MCSSKNVVPSNLARARPDLRVVVEGERCGSDGTCSFRKCAEARLTVVLEVFRSRTAPSSRCRSTKTDLRKSPSGSGLIANSDVRDVARVGVVSVDVDRCAE